MSEQPNQDKFLNDMIIQVRKYNPTFDVLAARDHLKAILIEARDNEYFDLSTERYMKSGRFSGTVMYITYSLQEARQPGFCIVKSEEDMTRVQLGAAGLKPHHLDLVKVSRLLSVLETRMAQTGVGKPIVLFNHQTGRYLTQNLGADKASYWSYLREEAKCWESFDADLVATIQKHAEMPLMVRMFTRVSQLREVPVYSPQPLRPVT